MRINLFISRDAAIKAGSNTFGATTVEVDVAKLTEDQRTMLVKALGDGTRSISTETGGQHHLSMGEHGLASEEAVIWRLNEFMQEDSLAKEKSEREYEAIVSILLAMPQGDD